MADRTVWWQAQDETSMVQLLQDAAASSTVLDFAPRPAPQGTDPAMLHRAAVAIAKARVAKDHSSQDRVLMEEVKAIDDLLRAANLLVERLREWHALQDTEAVRSAADAEALVKQVLETEGTNPAALDEADRVVLHGFADALGAVQRSWRAIEERVSTLMMDVAPNITSVAGPMVGARLITLAGGLPRLGLLPSSTIQTLGAETALFRHIKEGTKGPKHGILFQHNLVHLAPPWQRGAIARTMANHVALAARADATTGNDLTAMLQESMESDLVRLRERKAKAPFRPRPGTGRGPPKGGRPGGKGPGGKGGFKGGPKGKGGGQPHGKRPHKGGSKGKGGKQ